MLRRNSPMAENSAWAARAASAPASSTRAGLSASSSSRFSNMSFVAAARSGHKRVEDSPYKERLDCPAGAGRERLAHRAFGRLLQSRARGSQARQRTRLQTTRARLCLVAGQPAESAQVRAWHGGF